MKVACVLVTHLRAKVELRRQPQLQATPAVIVDRSGGRPVVVDALPATAGVTPGMTLEEALSRHTNTTILEADEPAYQRVYQQVLTSLQGVSDRVEGRSRARPTSAWTAWRSSTAASPASSAPC